MRLILIIGLLAAVSVPSRAEKHDTLLSGLLARDFQKNIMALPSGRAAYSRLEKAGPPARTLRILIRRDPGNWLASFSPEDNAVYFNAVPLAGFLGVKDASESAVALLLYRDPGARAALAGRADATFLHETVHALQYYLYPDYRRDVPKGVPLEFEYEAYLAETIYMHEKLSRSPERLRTFLRGGGRDVYTVAAMNGYLALSLDLAAYKENIRKMYEENTGGFISLGKAEELQHNAVENSKILAFASGRTKEYSDKQDSLNGVRREKEAYDKFLKDFYERRWPSFSAEALFFLGSAALEEKVYPLALECLAVADVNAVKQGVPAGDLRRLREKGALAILEAAAFIKDKASGMDPEALGRQLRALEKACLNTGRPFPGSLEAVRSSAYPKVFKFYSEKAAAEKDPGKARICAENAAHFRQLPGKPDGQ